MIFPHPISILTKSFFVIASLTAVFIVGLLIGFIIGLIVGNTFIGDHIEEILSMLRTLLEDEFY